MCRLNINEKPERMATEMQLGLVRHASTAMSENCVVLSPSSRQSSSNQAFFVVVFNSFVPSGEQPGSVLSVLNSLSNPPFVARK